MNLYIDDRSQVRSIQKQFNAYYPFLKLEFFKNHTNEKNFSKAETFTSDEFIKNLFTKNKEGIINISEKRIVAEVENDFKNKFGLLAQIFRLSGNVWIETSLTDDWTLEKQNKEGEQISSHFVVKHSKEL
jgi:hypothetical protein